jgi:hypothetical protein
MSGRGPALEQRLLDLIRALPTATAQNRLMSASDRDLALALFSMDEQKQDMVLSHLSKIKADRVREELLRHRHTRIRYRYQESALHTLIRHLSSERPVKGARSYYRPTRISRR